MRVTELDTIDSNKFRFAAFSDARQRSLAESSRYSEAQKIRAERMKFGLELVYASKNVYITFRQKFISVKVENAVVSNKKELKLLEDEWTKEGITKAVTKQGVIYRIAKK